MNNIKITLLSFLLCALMLTVSCEDESIVKLKEQEETSQVKVFALTSEPSKLPPSNAFDPVSLSFRITKKCFTGPSSDNVFDYYASANVEGLGADWHLINPNGVLIDLGTTGAGNGNCSGAESGNQHVEFGITGGSTMGTWTLRVTRYYPEFTGCDDQIHTESFTLPKHDYLVSSGSSNDFDVYRETYRYESLFFDITSDIIDIGIDYTNDLVCTWTSKGLVYYGTTNELDKFNTTYNGDIYGGSFTGLPSGYTNTDIVGIDIDGDNDRVYTWLKAKNGLPAKRIIGSSKNLSAYGGPVTVSLPAGYTTNDIVDIAIDGDSNWTWVFFKNGKKCAGSTTNLNCPYSSLQNYTLPCSYTTADVVAIACDGDNNAIYAWYK